MERVLGVLQEEGMKFPVIALAREQKVPAYKLAALKARFPETRFVNLNFEVDYDHGLAFSLPLYATRWTNPTPTPTPKQVDYDNGRSFRNTDIAWSAAKMVRVRV